MRRAIYTGMSVMSVMLSVAASLAAPPLRWDTQQANPKAADWYIYRGEAVDLMPRLVDGTKPVDITDTPATLRYREPALEPVTYRAIAATNTAPGTWLIPWRAEHDSGAPYYDYQLWIGDGPSASARITGKIIMRDSIGIPPGGPPPPPIAGYATPADLQAASNALANATATALTQAKAYTDRQIGAIPPATNATAISGGALVQATNVAEAVVAAAAPTLAVASAATVTGPQSNTIATALQPSWATTGTVFRATEVIGAQSTLIETAWQNPANAANWTWTSNGKEITLTGYSGPAAVVIPDMLDGLPVTGFGTIFYGNQDITSVVGGRFITVIGDYAFGFSSITTAKFPQATTIGDYAFEYSSLATANFPQATTIGDSAFAGTSLTTANFPQATTIGYYAFGNTPLTTANFPQVTTIGDSAFEYSSLTTANFPQMTTIGDSAFTGTPLTTANFPQATTIGDYAFRYCINLTSLYLGQNAPAEAFNVFEGTPDVTVYVTDPTATGYGATWNGRPVVRMPLFADKLTLKGTNIEDRITAKVNAATEPLISEDDADTKYLSSTPGWFWQGSQAVVTNEWHAQLGAPAAAGPGVNNFELIPYTTSRTDATGTVTITSSHYIVGVGCDWHLAKNPDLTIPSNPMVTKSRRVSSNEWELVAYCSSNPYDANPFWYAYASNVVVMTYDRQEMRPGAYTNDAAGIITRVDDAPRGRNSTRFDDDRRAVNAGTLEAYINDRKTEIADHAYNRTPGGRDAPSKYTFTVDLPMVMQGQIAYLNSGDYYIMSYQGGDWYNSVTGSVWRIGPAGSVSFEIASTNRLLHIQGFHVSGGYATVDISTNWVAGTPVVEFTDSLINQQWLEAPEQVINDHGAYWRVVVPATAPKRFFRAVDRQGDNRIISHVTHEFKDDIILFGRRYSSLAELKQALEELD
jgi:hypothetical protein